MNWAWLATIAFKIIGVLWRSGGREYARGLIDDPNYTWDDCIMDAADQVFGYKSTPKPECTTDGGADEI